MKAAILVWALLLSFDRPCWLAEGRERPRSLRSKPFDHEAFTAHLITMSPAAERPLWRRFLERRFGWPPEEKRLRATLQPKVLFLCLAFAG
ncbi:unnamed protein product [Durusdinium trenchii]|uniref:Uncharacterized protein n=1 Tax=Durusdinium trenchii TaxID=1381693 RepID=A0ABP0QT25_9DINO